MQPIGADKICRLCFGGNVKFPPAQKRQRARRLPSWFATRCADQEQFLFLGSFSRMTQGGETVPPSSIYLANPPTTNCTSDTEQPSRSSVSFSSSSDEDHASAVRGLPDVILMGLASAMDAARKQTMLRKNRHGGSQPGKRPNRNLGREGAARRLHADFFLSESEANPCGGTGPTFTGAEFERRLRVNARVNDRVKAGVFEYDRIYLEHRANALGTLGAATDQTFCIALRLLGEGIGAYSAVELSRLSESTSAKCLTRFCAAVIRAFGDQYLRTPSADDFKRIEATYSKLGLPEFFGPIDCTS
jgi:hypothetical protein